MSIANNKLRTLCVMKILMQYSDENHIMSSADIIKQLGYYGISANRQSIYSDIETLRTFGMDIISNNGGTKPGFYLSYREFELPELKLLVDAVQSSKFITAKKSYELIKKIERLTSVHEANQLQRQIFIYNRPKTGNETIYYNIDCIQQGLLTDKKIRFHYMEWDIHKKLVPKREGYYIVSPWALTWDDENYYMIAYSARRDKILHYRVDKMKDAEIVEDELRSGKDKFDKFDLAAFAKKTFGMYGGYECNVSLICDNKLVGVIIDRFGCEIVVTPVDKTHVKVTVPVTVSQQFFGWLTGLEGKVVIKEPVHVKDEYKEYMENILKKYK